MTGVTHSCLCCCLCLRRDLVLSSTCPPVMMTLHLGRGADVRNAAVEPRSFRVDFQAHPLHRACLAVTKEMQTETTGEGAEGEGSQKIGPQLFYSMGDSDFLRMNRANLIKPNQDGAKRGDEPMNRSRFRRGGGGAFACVRITHSPLPGENEKGRGVARLDWPDFCASIVIGNDVGSCSFSLELLCLCLFSDNIRVSFCPQQTVVVLLGRWS